MLKPTTIASHLKHRGRVIEVSTEVLRYANGREYALDFVRHPGAAAVVAIDQAGRVCMVRQYRHGTGDFLWEVPAGKLDRGEAPHICAVRELAEETGVTARHWQPMGVYFAAPGIYDEVIHLYLARDLDLGKAAPDADEGRGSGVDLVTTPEESAGGLRGRTAGSDDKKIESSRRR